MKRIFTYLTILSAGIVLAASCSKNQPPVFDDSRAFVAFDKPTVSINEAIVAPDGTIGPQTAVLRVPVTLASTKGIAETVKFTVKEEEFLYKDYIDPEGDLKDKSNWIDKTAHEDVNFKLKTTSKTLTFTAEQRTQYIEFDVLYLDTYTGDLKFDIVLSKPESIDLGFNTTCTVVIGDVNHPLTAILGEYTATGNDYWDGPSSWVMTLEKDETDDHMVWIYNPFNNSGWAVKTTSPYGNVDADLTTITIPLGQKPGYVYSNGEPFIVLGINDSEEGFDSGNMTAKIVKDDTGKVTGLDFGKEYGFWGYINNTGSVGIVLPGITATKN
jgi:hypothetical protein